MKRFERDSLVVRDLKINFEKIMNGELLSPFIRDSIIYLISSLNKDEEIVQIALKNEEITESKAREILDAGSIMTMLNFYYKNKYSLESKNEYGNPGLRMQSLMNSPLGKIHFEILAFATSCFNGCPYCVDSHEKVLRKEGLNESQVNEIIKIVSIIKALKEI